MEKVGARIRTLRQAKGLNQTELAAKVGVDQSTISDIETKDTAFSVIVLMRLADALETTEAMILRGHDEATWPFKHVQQARFLALNAEQRAYIEGRLGAELDHIDSPPPKPDTFRLTGSTSTRKKKVV